MPFSRQRLLARWPEVSRRGKLQLAAYQGFLRRGILMAAIYLCFLGLVGPQLNWGRLTFWGAALIYLSPRRCGAPQRGISCGGVRLRQRAERRLKPVARRDRRAVSWPSGWHSVPRIFAY
jgi:hypothetical protein